MKRAVMLLCLGYVISPAACGGDDSDGRARSGPTERTDSEAAEPIPPTNDKSPELQRFKQERAEPASGSSAGELRAEQKKRRARVRHRDEPISKAQKLRERRLRSRDDGNQSKAEKLRNQTR